MQISLLKPITLTPKPKHFATYSIYEYDRSEYIIKKHVNNKLLELEVRDIDFIKSAFSKKKTEKKNKLLKGVLNPNVIYTDLKGKHIWFAPAKKRVLLFNDEGKGVKKYNVLVPGVIFFMNSNTLKVFFYKRLNQDILQTQLYYNLFYNTNSNGNVCLNESVSDYSSVDELVRMEEQLFWNSPFSHIGNEFLVDDKSGLVKMSTKEIKDLYCKIGRISLSWLRPCHKTINSLI